MPPRISTTAVGGGTDQQAARGGGNSVLPAVQLPHQVDNGGADQGDAAAGHGDGKASGGRVLGSGLGEPRDEMEPAEQKRENAGCNAHNGFSFSERSGPSFFL